MPRKRTSEAQKRAMKQDFFSRTHSSTQQDMDMAQTVAQVVNDLVAQVADEPYGELCRKRPTFSYVLRKFVRDSVQAHHEEAISEVIVSKLKKVPRHEVDYEMPYGIDLVWGVVLAEMEKVSKRERARVYSAQKAIRKREKKRLEAIQAAHTNLMTNVSLSNSDSSDDEENENRQKKATIVPLAIPTEPPILMPFSSPSPRSDDSDWAVPPPKWRKTPNTSRINSMPHTKAANNSREDKSRLLPTISEYGQPLISDFFPQQHIRGRGRPRGTSKSMKVPSGASLANKSKSRANRSTATKAAKVERDLPMMENDEMEEDIPMRECSLSKNKKKGPVNANELRTLLQKLREEKIGSRIKREEEEEEKGELADMIETSGDITDEGGVEETREERRERMIWETINEVVSRTTSCKERKLNDDEEREREHSSRKKRSISVTDKMMTEVKKKKMSKDVKEEEEEKKNEDIITVSSDSDESLKKPNARITHPIDDRYSSDEEVVPPSQDYHQLLSAGPSWKND